jgi:FKBP-type peptidyl-prolyl cis-trans isomerase
MKLIVILIFLISLLACSESPKPKHLSAKEIQEALLEANIKATQLESEQIEAYITEKEIEAIKTGTGLRYFIYERGEDGVKAEDGKKAVISYEVTLLDGTKCYSTDEHPEEFTIGSDIAESGLHEGITYMREGDKAIIIIPSHLAHGLAGDLNKIPIRSTIVYDIELIHVK